MKSAFSTSWKSSKQTRKQRKYRYNAPAHIQQKFMGVNLAKPLRKTHNTRSIAARTGDKVKIQRGQFKGITGEITRIDRKKGTLYIEGAAQQKRDGTKAQYPINPSNCQMETLNTKDKRRLKTEKTKEKEAPAKQQSSKSKAKSASS